MKIMQADFVGSAVRPEQYPLDEIPEIALVGRSNVGKSSLINCLLERKGLARTSSVPGKTQLINFFKINQKFFLVDLPGYGFAKVSKTLRQQWGKMVEKYLLEREPLKLVVLLIDMRHLPTEDDLMMCEWLQYYKIPICIVGTKADKIQSTKREAHFKRMYAHLNLPSSIPCIAFSSRTKKGREELWEIINTYHE